jgi:DNA-binding PadR family transcriptional regulator
MTGKAYAEVALRDVYRCCGALALPIFMCGHSYTHFREAVGPAFSDLCEAARQVERRTWSLVQLELRRADTSPSMVSLLLKALGREGVAVLQKKPVGAPSKVYHLGSSGTLEGQVLRALIAAKRRAIEVMRLASRSADGRTANEALEEALMDAYEVRKSSASQSADAAAVNPNAVLREAGWFGVNADADRVASFEEAAQLVELAYAG